jgi:thiamine-phosphate pyrophosphorylase
LLAKLENPIVCYVTDRKSLSEDDALSALRARIRIAIAAGVDWVQIREKDLPARELLALACEAVAATEAAKPQRAATGMGAARVIVNDRLDMALAAGAAGVHLGGESVPVAEVVRWCRGGNAPAGFLVGRSCHGVEDARAAERAGANYVIYGPVFDTPSKRGFGPPQGIARLKEVCAAVKIPVIAIGGVSAENSADCMRVGAAGIAAIRIFQEAAGDDELRAWIAKLRRQL